MSELIVYTEAAVPARRTTDPAVIASLLKPAGIRFEQWKPSAPVAAGAAPEAILAAYRADVDRIVADNGFATVDVISVNADTPDKAALRMKFLSEHLHTEDEVRFFVDGRGLFYLHVGDKVYSVLCEKGDFISVPANVCHWFDMGSEPVLAAIRFFNNTDGWVAHYSGDTIANHFPRLDS